MCMKNSFPEGTYEMTSRFLLLTQNANHQRAEKSTLNCFLDCGYLSEQSPESVFFPWCGCLIVLSIQICEDIYICGGKNGDSSLVVFFLYCFFNIF